LDHLTYQLENTKKEEMIAPIGSKSLVPMKVDDITFDNAGSINSSVEMQINDTNLKMCQFFGIKISNYESPNFINYVRTEETNPDSLGNTFLTLDIKEETKLREEFIKQALALKAPFTDTQYQ
jgi:hypothetical protein